MTSISEILSVLNALEIKLKEEIALVEGFSLEEEEFNRLQADKSRLVDLVASYDWDELLNGGSLDSASLSSVRRRLYSVKELSAVGSELVNNRLRQTQAAINLLRASSSFGESLTYDQSRNIRKSNSSQRLLGSI